MSTQYPRRTIIQGAGLGLGAGLMSGVASAAETSGAAAQPAPTVWSSEYWANKGDVKLNLWRKRIGAPRAGEPALPTLFLVHGSSNSARTSYDLNVPGRGEY